MTRLGGFSSSAKGGAAGAGAGFQRAKGASGFTTSTTAGATDSAVGGGNQLAYAALAAVVLFAALFVVKKIVYSDEDQDAVIGSEKSTRGQSRRKNQAKARSKSLSSAYPTKPRAGLKFGSKERQSIATDKSLAEALGMSASAIGGMGDEVDIYSHVMAVCNQFDVNLDDIQGDDSDDDDGVDGAAPESDLRYLRKALERATKKVCPKMPVDLSDVPKLPRLGKSYTIIFPPVIQNPDCVGDLQAALDAAGSSRYYWEVSGYHNVTRVTARQA